MAEKNTEEIRNLLFLQDFMVLQDISVPQAAEMLGYTRHAILKWFRNDDAPLSIVQTLFEKCGYRLELRYDRQPGNPSIKVTFPEDLQTVSTNRLSFLDRALRMNGITRVAASKLMGMGDSAVSHWLKVDDCSISHLFNLAEKIGLVLNIEIKKI